MSIILKSKIGTIYIILSNIASYIINVILIMGRHTQADAQTPEHTTQCACISFTLTV